MKHDCKPLVIPEDCCYVSFGKIKKPIVPAGAIDLVTVRGEMMIIDMTKDDKVIGFELVHTKMKPCQTGR